MPEIIELPDDVPSAKSDPEADDLPKELVFYPFAYALLDDELRNHCWYCLKEAATGNLKRCSGCHGALFCDKQCQVSGWLDHKPECKALKSCSKIPDVEVRMLGRIVYRHKRILEGDDKADNFYLNRTSERSIMEIWSHAEEMLKDSKAMIKFRRIEATLTNFYDPKFLLDSETIFQLHSRNYINRHAISDQSYLREIGKGLYLDMCRYDHSCAPNTIYTCEGFVATLRPLQAGIDIRDWTKTFYTYIDLLATKQERKRMLKETWYFDCRCTRCLDENEHVLTGLKCSACGGPVFLFGQRATDPLSCSTCGDICSESRADAGREAMTAIDRSIDQGKFDSGPTEAGLDLARGLLKAYQPLLHAANIFYTRLLQQAILHMHYGEESAAEMLRFHQDAEACMRICFPANHPALAYHLMNIGRFCADQDRGPAAKQYLLTAEKMMLCALGPNHSMTKQAQEHLASLQ